MVKTNNQQDSKKETKTKTKAIEKPKRKVVEVKNEGSTRLNAAEREYFSGLAMPYIKAGNYWKDIKDELIGKVNQFLMKDGSINIRYVNYMHQLFKDEAIGRIKHQKRGPKTQRTNKDNMGPDEEDKDSEGEEMRQLAAKFADDDVEMSGVAPSHSTSSKANLAKKKVVAQLASLPCHNKTYKSLKTNHTEHKKQNSIEQNNYNSTTQQLQQDNDFLTREVRFFKRKYENYFDESKEYQKQLQQLVDYRANELYHWHQKVDAADFVIKETKELLENEKTKHQSLQKQHQALKEEHDSMKKQKESAEVLIEFLLFDYNNTVHDLVQLINKMNQNEEMKKRIVPWLCFDESLTDSNNWFQDRLGSYPYELLQQIILYAESIGIGYQEEELQTAICEDIVMTGLAILEWRKEKYRKEDRGNRFGFGEYKEVYLRMYVGGNELKELLRKHVEESEEISPTYQAAFIVISKLFTIRGTKDEQRQEDQEIENQLLALGCSIPNVHPILDRLRQENLRSRFYQGRQYREDFANEDEVNEREEYDMLVDLYIDSVYEMRKLTDEQIGNFFGERTTIAGVDESGICVICMDPLRRLIGREIVSGVNCDHKLHVECIAEQLRNGRDECVLCRRLIVTPETDQERIERLKKEEEERQRQLQEQSEDDEEDDDEEEDEEQ